MSQPRRRTPCGSRTIPVSVLLVWLTLTSILYWFVPALDTAIFVAFALAVTVVLFMHAVPEFVVYQYSRPTYLDKIASDSLAITVFVILSCVSLFGLGLGTFLVLVGETASGKPGDVWTYNFLNALATWLILYWSWQYYAIGIALWVATKIRQHRGLRLTARRHQRFVTINPIARAVSRKRRIPIVTSLTQHHSGSCPAIATMLSQSEV